MLNNNRSVQKRRNFSRISMKSLFVIAACSLSLCFVRNAAAQESQDTSHRSVDNFANSAETMSLPEARNYNNYLDRVLGAIHSLDPTMQAELPQWVVNDRELKRRIIALLQKDPQFRAQISQLSDVIVTQNPRTQELLRLTVAAVVLNSRDEIEAKLGTTIYDKLKDGSYDKLMVANPVLEQRSYGIYFSLYKGYLALEKSGFAFEWINGKEEIGYPFWLNGTMTLGGAFIRDNFTMHLGIDVVPSGYGNSTAPIVGPFNIPNRKLEGTSGASVSGEIKNFGLDPNDGRLGATGLFTYSFGENPGPAGFSIAPYNLAYNVSHIELLYLTYAFPVEGDLNGFSISVGGGAHSIDYNKFIPGTPTVAAQTNLISRTTFGDVYGKIAYDFHGEDHWGMSLQYSNLLLGDVYYDILQGFGLEAKYALVLNNRNSPWEYKSFFIISPRISFEL